MLHYEATNRSRNRSLSGGHVAVHATNLRNELPNAVCNRQTAHPAPARSRQLLRPAARAVRQNTLARLRKWQQVLRGIGLFWATTAQTRSGQALRLRAARREWRRF